MQTVSGSKFFTCTLTTLFRFLCLCPFHNARGVQELTADLLSRSKPEIDECRKLSHGHPTLSPGIFTLYCQHGVCYGFEVMESAESPKVPFRIFKTRFPTPPERIVYDNACKLHQYSLNCEPHFRSTKFLVDRFHWKGHVGCSRGYCLDAYSGLDSRSLNSQVNEQANAGLQRIRGQLAYMTPKNFVFHANLFLAIKNIDACSKLNIYDIHV